MLQSSPKIVDSVVGSSGEVEGVGIRVLASELVVAFGSGILGVLVREPISDGAFYIVSLWFDNVVLECGCRISFYIEF